jgi:hypothetical protein
MESTSTISYRRTYLRRKSQKPLKFLIALVINDPSICQEPDLNRSYLYRIYLKHCHYCPDDIIEYWENILCCNEDVKYECITKPVDIVSSYTCSPSLTWYNSYSSQRDISLTSSPSILTTNQSKSTNLSSIDTSSYHSSKPSNGDKHSIKKSPHFKRLKRIYPTSLQSTKSLSKPSVIEPSVVSLFDQEGEVSIDNNIVIEHASFDDQQQTTANHQQLYVYSFDFLSTPSVQKSTTSNLPTISNNHQESIDDNINSSNQSHSPTISHQQPSFYPSEPDQSISNETMLSQSRNNHLNQLSKYILFNYQILNQIPIDNKHFPTFRQLTFYQSTNRHIYIQLIILIFDPGIINHLFMEDEDGNKTIINQLIEYQLICNRNQRLYINHYSNSNNF